MENKKSFNSNTKNNNKMTFESESMDDSESAKESQTFIVKGLEHITEEYRNNLMSFIQDKIKEIKKQERDIKGDINNLAQTIQEIVDKNHKDFISTFANFMDSVRKDLKLKLEQMEKIEEEKRKINDIRSIKCERDYFRLEAIRLSRMTNNLKKKIEDMALKMKLLNESVENLQLKLKDSEGVNKQLLLELEKNIKSQKEIERELNIMKDLSNNNKEIRGNNLAEGEKMETTSTQAYENERRNQEISLLNDQMRRLRYELRKEKERSHMALGELNKIYLERNKLENIFIDCVEETRKIIFNRKLKENNGGYKIKQRIGMGKYDYKMNLKTKYESFLPSDKQSILENFVFNDEVSNIIRDAIFTRPKKEKEKLENTKNIIKNLNLYEQSNKGRSNSFKNKPISGSKKQLSGKEINQRFNEAMKEFENKEKGGISGNNTGNQFYNAGRMTMSNFKEHQFGHSSKITVPMQIS